MVLGALLRLGLALESAGYGGGNFLLHLSMQAPHWLVLVLVLVLQGVVGIGIVGDITHAWESVRIMTMAAGIAPPIAALQLLLLALSGGTTALDLSLSFDSEAETAAADHVRDLTGVGAGPRREPRTASVSGPGSLHNTGSELYSVTSDLILGICCGQRDQV